jgi:hypothetical protein
MAFKKMTSSRMTLIRIAFPRMPQGIFTLSRMTQVKGNIRMTLSRMTLNRMTCTRITVVRMPLGGRLTLVYE